MSAYLARMERKYNLYPHSHSGVEMKAYRPLHALTFTLAEARTLVEMFDGDEEAEVSVAAGTKAAHSGPGLYGWWSDYTDEGSVKLGAETECHTDCTSKGKP